MGMSVGVALLTAYHCAGGIYRFKKIFAGGGSAAMVSRKINVCRNVEPGCKNIFFRRFLCIPGEQETVLPVLDKQGHRGIIGIIILIVWS